MLLPCRDYQGEPLRTKVRISILQQTRAPYSQRLVINEKNSRSLLGPTLTCSPLSSIVCLLLFVDNAKGLVCCRVASTENSLLLLFTGSSLCDLPRVPLCSLSNAFSDVVNRYDKMQYSIENEIGEAVMVGTGNLAEDGYFSLSSVLCQVNISERPGYHVRGLRFQYDEHFNYF